MSPPAVIEPDVARAAALVAADSLFYARGVNDVTMAEIRDHSGVSLRRLYSMYPSKSHLVEGWLEERHSTWMADHSSRFDRLVVSGSDPIDATFGAIAAWLVDTEFRGCGFINTNAELGDLTDRQREIIRHHKTAVADRFERLFANGRAIAILADGAIVQAAMFESVAPVETVRACAHAVRWADLDGV